MFYLHFNNNSNHHLKNNSCTKKNKEKNNILLNAEQVGSGLYSIVTGNGINGNIGDVGEEFSFQVLTYHSNGNQKKVGGDIVSVFIQGCDYHNLEEDVKVRVSDRMNGTFIVYYNVNKSGHYMISVMVNHVSVVGGPFKVNVSPLNYNVDILDKHTLVAGQDIVCQIQPKKTSIHPINDRIDIQLFIKEGGVLKKTVSEITTHITGVESSTYPTTTETTIQKIFKLLKTGEYIIEGTIVGVPIFQKSFTINSGPVSSKYSHLVWDGKELISENKLFILKNNTPYSEFKFLIETKDKYGNIALGSDLKDFKYYLKRSLTPIMINNNNNNNNGNSNSLDNNIDLQQQQQNQINNNLNNGLKEIQPEIHIDYESKNIKIKLNIKKEGWYCFCVKVNDQFISNSPFVIVTIKENDFQNLSNSYSLSKATFHCQIDKNNYIFDNSSNTQNILNNNNSNNKRLSNIILSISKKKIEILESYYFINIGLFEFNINPTVQIQLVGENNSNLIIKDNKSKVLLYNCPNQFLIILTSYYFMGFQSEPTFDSKIKWLKSSITAHTASKSGLSRNKMNTLKINISSRDNILEESLSILKAYDGKDLVTSRLIVKFNDEEGVDIGGISKEWYSKLSEEIGKKPIQGYYLFDQYPGSHVYHPSPLSNLVPDFKSCFKTLGKITAKSVYDSVLKADRHLSIKFAPAFYKLIVDEPLSLDDIQQVDPQLYKNKIEFITNNPMDYVNEILGEPLYFSREIYNPNHPNTGGGMSFKTVNLKPFGNLIKVTDENKQEYIDLLVQNIFYTSIKVQVDEFKEGFYSIIPQNIISIFNSKELEMLICGRDIINFDDLRLHSIFTGLFNDDIISLFWEVVNEFNELEKKLLLKFVTGSSAVPLGGFYQLCPHFTINIIPNINNNSNSSGSNSSTPLLMSTSPNPSPIPSEPNSKNNSPNLNISENTKFNKQSILCPTNTENRLPISHTCFNRLDIPFNNCFNKNILYRNLKLAITEASEGFSLI
ncbi:hypothetical protein CYY_003513 [Polysphondylium violaceum]|uniref:HECT-type E3 ubiquitin transferase n=1 Tax=Polysphondylium violaceum TaxID=133409 RepID=A0A8J4V054_9MYCE|nr:hypothetical protein CYY_003513 [Polysphondylium violaceum]